MIDFDALVLAPCMASFGTPAVWTSGTGAVAAITGVFDANHAEVHFQNEAPVASTRPMLGIRASVAQPERGDLLAVAGVTYVVQDVVADGHGHLKLLLTQAAP